jgi:hypothetical protein
MTMMNEHGPVFVICRNRRAALDVKKRLPKGSKVVVDPCALDNYMDQDTIKEIEETSAAKAMMGVN